jgi:hypothetical protein
LSPVTSRSPYAASSGSVVACHVKPGLDAWKSTLRPSVLPEWPGRMGLGHLRFPAPKADTWYTNAAAGC